MNSIDARVSLPGFRSGNSNRSMWPPETSLIDGRWVAEGAPWLMHTTVADQGRSDRAELGAVIESARWTGRHTRPEVIKEMFARVAPWSSPNGEDLLPVLDLTDPQLLIDVGIRAGSIVGDSGSPEDYRRCRSLIEPHRSWSGAFLLPSAALADARTLLVPRAWIAESWLVPGAAIHHRYPPAVLDHIFHRQTLASTYALP